MHWRSKRKQDLGALIATCPECRSETRTHARWTARQLERLATPLAIYCATCREGRTCQPASLRLERPAAGLG